MATQTAIELQSPIQYQQAAEPSTQAAESFGGRTTKLSSVLEGQTPTPKLSKSRSWVVLVQLCGINFISSLSSGLLTIGLPAIASSLKLSDSLLLWPTSVFSLTGGSCLLIAGSVTDVLGPRRVNLLGSFVIAACILACGLARDGTEIILFRALEGIGTALFVPSAVSIVSTNIEHGRPRNIGFALIFLAYPLGYGLGLALGGVFVNTVGWRVGFFAGGATGFLLFLIGVRTLPKDKKLGEDTMKRLRTEIDWVGALIASTCLSTCSYVLAKLSADTANIKEAVNIVLLTLSLILVPTFPVWMRYQERRHKPALIPNSLWKNASFTSVCLMALFSNAVVSCMGLFSSLFFQKVQLLSAMETSLRILPQILMGTTLCIFSGIFINKVPIRATVLILTALCAVAPLLMALINPGWPYWYSALWAQLLTPLSIDITLTVGTLVVTDVFPTRTQALAGAVFNTFSQLGASIGLCVLSVISVNVTEDNADTTSPQALLKGYRASFWALFACLIIACLIGAAGLRKIGKVGAKKD